MLLSCEGTLRITLSRGSESCNRRRRTERRKKHDALWIDPAVPTIFTISAAAQTIVYVDVAVDYPNVVATGTTDTNYAMAGRHTAYATVTVRSPSGRLSTVTVFHGDAVTGSTLLSISNEYGNWLATNHGTEYCPLGNVTYDRGTTSAAIFIGVSETTGSFYPRPARRAITPRT